MTISWWAPALEPRLSQGDLLDDTVFALARHPLTPLTKASLGGKPGYVPGDWSPDSNGVAELLAAGRRGYALVLTHSCELDKAKAGGRVIVCPVQPIATIPTDQRPEIYAQKPWSKMPLPSVLGRGDFVADLHLSMAIDRRVVDTTPRLTSMTKDARRRLRLQLIAFYTRLDARDGALPDEDVPDP